MEIAINLFKYPVEILAKSVRDLELDHALVCVYHLDAKIRQGLRHTAIHQGCSLFNNLIRLSHRQF